MAQQFLDRAGTQALIDAIRNKYDDNNITPSTSSYLGTLDTTTKSGQTYPVYKNSEGKLVVNVPWTNTVTTNTDTKVTQNTLSSTGNYPLLMSYYTTVQSTTTAQTVNRIGTIYGNRNGELYANKFITPGGDTSYELAIGGEAGFESDVSVGGELNVLGATMFNHDAQVYGTLFLMGESGSTGQYGSIYDSGNGEVVLDQDGLLYSRGNLVLNEAQITIPTSTTSSNLSTLSTTAVAGKTYPVQKNNNGKLVVNVDWDSGSSYGVFGSGTNGLVPGPSSTYATTSYFLNGKGGWTIPGLSTKVESTGVRRAIIGAPNTTASGTATLTEGYRNNDVWFDGQGFLGALVVQAQAAAVGSGIMYKKPSDTVGSFTGILFDATENTLGNGELYGLFNSVAAKEGAFSNLSINNYPVMYNTNSYASFTTNTEYFIPVLTSSSAGAVNYVSTSYSKYVFGRVISGSQTSSTSTVINIFPYSGTIYHTITSGTLRTLTAVVSNYDSKVYGVETTVIITNNSSSNVSLTYTQTSGAYHKIADSCPRAIPAGKTAEISVMYNYGNTTGSSTGGVFYWVGMIY